MNLLAPEHAELAVRGARAVAASINTRGRALHRRAQRPSRWRDYFAGPSHVLPTGAARAFASPLGVADVREANLDSSSTKASRAAGPGR